MPPYSLSEGKAPFVYKGEEYQTWYKIVDSPQSIASGRPLIIIHGGPGSNHLYTLALEDLATKYGIKIIFYDQLGCGYSTHLPDKGRDFWTCDLFTDELENLLRHLAIEDEFDILGHSWGGMLASWYAAKRAPVSGLKRLIISNSPASMPLFELGCRKLLSEMPEDVRQAIEKHEADGTTDSKEYEDAVNAFYARHLIRVPMPDVVVKSDKIMAEDPTVFHTMNGPSEFTITGTLKTWSIIDDLHRITQPTLLINGQYDEVQDVAVAPFFRHIQNCKWIQLAQSSHMAFWEGERERYMQAVHDFLAGI